MHHATKDLEPFSTALHATVERIGNTEPCNHHCLYCLRWAHAQGVTPEIHHALLVQRLLVQAGIDDACISAAGILHDALENNPGAFGKKLSAVIKESLGEYVFNLVNAVTDDAPPDLPRTQRKERQFARMAQAPWPVKVIKLADVVASLQEGPAPNWSLQHAAHYVHQRNKLVTEVLQDSSAELSVCYQQALEMPAWKDAISYAECRGSAPTLVIAEK